MEIIEVNNKNQWNTFIATNGGSFLQSWEWGEAQIAVGRKVWRLGLVDDNNILAGILIIKYNLALGKSYLFAPWAGWFNEDCQNLFLAKIKEIARQEKAVFFRYEPLIEGEEKEKQLQKAGFVYGGSVEPEDTLLIDLEKDEEELLAKMHPKTRYNIRLAEKKGVKINRYQSSAVQNWHFENFWQLIKRTYNRKGITAHAKDYYQKILQQEIFHLYLAEYQGKIIVANLLSFFGKPPQPRLAEQRLLPSGTVTYLHGGSDDKFQNTMAASLIQWQAIKDAKVSGYKYYDFYGIAADGKKKNTWEGITRFKKGFGGIEKHYIGAWDFVFDKGWYVLYRIGRRIR
jgi:lipid II:glycine glycyltransferase (peptidoglycan interpeptide bridge formation enzyme)